MPRGEGGGPGRTGPRLGQLAFDPTTARQVGRPETFGESRDRPWVDAKGTQLNQQTLGNLLSGGPSGNQALGTGPGTPVSFGDLSLEQMSAGGAMGLVPTAVAAIMRGGLMGLTGAETGLVNSPKPTFSQMKLGRALLAHFDRMQQGPAGAPSIPTPAFSFGDFNPQTQVMSGASGRAVRGSGRSLLGRGIGTIGVPGKGSLL